MIRTVEERSNGDATVTMDAQSDQVETVDDVMIKVVEVASMVAGKLITW